MSDPISSGLVGVGVALLLYLAAMFIAGWLTIESVLKDVKNRMRLRELKEKQRRLEERLRRLEEGC